MKAAVIASVNLDEELLSALWVLKTLQAFAQPLKEEYTAEKVLSGVVSTSKERSDAVGDVPGHTTIWRGHQSHQYEWLVGCVVCLQGLEAPIKRLTRG